MTTLVDLEFKANTSDLDKARAKLKDVDNAAKDAAAAGAKLGGVLGVAFSTAVIAAGYFAEKLIDSMDALNDLHDATGASVENLSALQDVATRTGVQFGTVESALVKFNSQLQKLDPKSDSSRALKQIGLDAKELSDLDPAEALRRTAVALSQFADDGDKARLTQVLFGKSVKEVGAYLKDLSDQKELVVKVTAKEAEEAEKFNKQLYAMKANSEQAGRAILKDLLPPLTDLLRTFNDKGLLASIDQFGEKIFGWTTHADAKRIKTLTAEIKELGEEFNKTSSYVGKASIATQLDAKIAELKELQRQYYVFANGERLKLSDSAGGGRGSVNPSPAVENPSVGKLTPRPEKDDKMHFTDVTSEMLQQEKTLISLRQEYNRFFGVADETATQMLEAAIASGKYDHMKKDGIELTKAQTAVEIERLRVNAKIADNWKGSIAQLKEEIEARKGQFEIDSKMQNAARKDITARVLMNYGKTATDAAIEVGKYNIQLAESQLLSLKNANATSKEVEELEKKIKLLRAEQDGLGKQKKDEDAVKAEQRTFSYGWEQAFSKYTDDANNAALKAEQLFSTASKGMEDALVNFAMTGKLNFKDLANSIIADLIRMEAKSLTMKMFGSGGLGGLFSSLFSANGNAFDTGGILKSADGNVFDSPTLHGYSGGVGMLGEAGPEAVMPLKRNSNGQLGVMMQGSSGGTSIVNNYSVTVNGANDSQDAANKVVAQIKLMQQVADSRISNARRIGGVSNPLATAAF